MKNSVEEGKTTAIVAYLTIIGVLIALFMNQEKKNAFASFHIRQALGINLLMFIIGPLVTGFDSWWVSFPFQLIFIVFWAFGFIGAIQGKLSILPFVGEYFQKWFKNIA